MPKKKKTRPASQPHSQSLVAQPPKSVQARQLRTLRAVQMSARFTSGPIPDAEEMARYQQVQPDLPERIMRQFERRSDMAEKQSHHRISMEDRVVANNIVMERRGWLSATGLGGLVLVGSIWLIANGKSLEGFAGVILALTTLLGLYVFARKDQVQNIAKKRAVELLQRGATPEQLDLLPTNRGIDAEKI